MAGIYYEVRGNGEPLVLLHGNGEDHHLFDGFAEVFDGDFQLIAIDSRGHGRSEWLQPMTIDAMAEDVGCVLDELRIRSAHILGFSDGGNVALALALAYPKRIRSLVAVGANLFPAGMLRRVRFSITMWYGLLCALAPLSKSFRKKKQIADLMVHQPHIDSARLKRIACPSLIIAGENDMIDEAHTRMIASSIPGARLEIIPGADHFCIVKTPDRFHKIVFKFLKSNVGRSA